MCGICGKLEFDPRATVSPRLVKAMADAIVHRGPDDEGFYVTGQIGLGFRRLSIIDLSGGHQPLANENDTVWIIFNGEIYNYQELRAELVSKGHIFRTKSDTEVIVHLYEEYGVDCVQKLRGMFAFAIWDSVAKTLFLARDRVGIKPLYYYASNRFISFGSEIKTILADPAVDREIDPAIIERFLAIITFLARKRCFVMFANSSRDIFFWSGTERFRFDATGIWIFRTLMCSRHRAIWSNSSSSSWTKLSSCT